MLDETLCHRIQRTALERDEGDGPLPGSERDRQYPQRAFSFRLDRRARESRDIAARSHQLGAKLRGKSIQKHVRGLEPCPAKGVRENKTAGAVGREDPPLFGEVFEPDPASVRQPASTPA